ncbi:heat shock protein [Aequorivita sublithincola DSM 14238]|uniref:Heat shock protein n=1 Tax=Aequorivita sublithincola (strain DSM 14238 / LMG 21431 / ACAM 643 / 9-3) TaxID=746697 RepID=I3YU30_AEQSU|nr:T9SS type A sorting domain-containing protein [Aequorivita sublithincola]AFL80498.1 heat shock protein [Aequorivita sublithincola DSM 14238]
MKKILPLLLIVFMVLPMLAQNPNPELFKTWNLHKIEWDFGGALYIANIDPPISPYLTVNEDLSFEGCGACNSFSGNFEVVPNQDKVRPVDFAQTFNICETQFLNDFETVYFEFFSIEDDYSYEFYTDPSDNLRHMYYSNNPSGIWLDFVVGDPLSIDDNDFEKIEIYPNPTSLNLFIKSKKINIEKLTVYSISGKKIKECLPDNGAIDVSTLSKGIYFLEIVSSQGRSVQKFIKD